MNKLRILSLLAGALTLSVGPVVSPAYAKEQAQKETYTCPMHPEVKTHEPGDCPICHMKLVPMKNEAPEKKAPKSREKKVKFYRNPMNPAITSPVPMKDSMGMDYLPVYESDEAPAKDSPTGRAAFELSDEQALNVKLSTKKVERKPLIEKLAIAARVTSPGSIALQVLEADLSKVKSGQSLEFRTLGSTSGYAGKIASVDSALDPMSRTLRATGNLSSMRGVPLRLEQSGVATVSVDLGEGLAVPEDAILRTGRESLAYVVSGNKISPRAVKLGAKVGNSYQILEGLSEGEEISTGPNFLLDSEARIRGIHD